jgi:phosphoribosyl-ATP pyrophosphohydrolase
MLNKLFNIIEDRKINPVSGSYTNQLMDAGYGKIAQKVGEEAVEVILAAGTQGRRRVIEETSDLLFHLFVLLVQQGITLSEIEEELEFRHIKKSG